MLPSNAQKQRVWDDFKAGRPSRVPVALACNPRMILLDPARNPKGITYQEYCRDGRVSVEVQLQFEAFLVEYLSQFCDASGAWPAKLVLYVDTQNTADAAYFGCPIRYPEGQVPDTEPILLGAAKRRIFAMDLDHPLDHPFIQECLRRHEDMAAAAGAIRLPGVEVSVRPVTWGTEGVLTVATSLRGSDLYLDFVEDPEYVVELLEFINRGLMIRNRAMRQHAGLKPFDGPSCSFADDSIQLLSTEMYRRFVLPVHRRYVQQWSIEGPHAVHLCGDATRHFPILQQELNVQTFDTGYPVDHGKLRRTLGPQATIRGGVEVFLLKTGTPEQVHQRARGILQSGVMLGGKFILTEANNLPPGCPDANLAAMYRCCLEHGQYPDADRTVPREHQG